MPDVGQPRNTEAHRPATTMFTKLLSCLSWGVKYGLVSNLMQTRVSATFDKRKSAPASGVHQGFSQGSQVFSPLELVS